MIIYYKNNEVKIMFNIQTQTIDKISTLPILGTVIGCSTILLNTVKLTADVAKIFWYNLRDRGYEESKALKKFEKIDAKWEQLTHPRYKPQLDSKSEPVSLSFSIFQDPKKVSIIKNVNQTEKANWEIEYNQLSAADKRQVALKAAKKDAIQHLSFIGRGLIRAIPLLGGSLLWAYNVRQIPASTIKSEEITERQSNTNTTSPIQQQSQTPSRRRKRGQPLSSSNSPQKFDAQTQASNLREHYKGTDLKI